ncbi:Transcriptional regulator, DeoR family [Pseudonocardia sp. Ae168_Ps1]|uniref:helix-turn-helix transcriptional regulator n=1 Tax=unclassified Pseudonocardia TaxID=2619320 RepID=UPI00094B67E3|nr:MULTISPECIES: WYL domain-containing protein [unclassified Pseudonocardia]OLL75301.1 Transcriptional regulator, DeoR family [Pseudonocardia sp. Ae150A_Ps1]OLL81296.1 Transcriptional regulator, DeoR family [Pseudonocardia sp. Ae168_Ps1]OLL84591.1 Transcriptional regulator, DeoR family [Pseudonocardia sp. Ae263_Ps1]OLL95390.1 Transcriptional regulator, DeoR family [Pseudonocardia sp. Ae356_Ps1]
MTTPTARLLDLLSLLQARRDWPGTLLAERLGISHRTVRRDVERLRDMGYRIQATMGPDGGYRLDAGTELPPLLFDDDQVVALTVALQAATLTGAGIEEAALRALTTVRQVMPARLRHRLDALRFATVPRPGAAPPTTVPPDVLITLSGAVRALEVLRFDYPGRHADAGERPPRRVEPHDLVTSGGRWYLVAWDLERADWRVFRADRIIPRIPAGPRFAPRPIPGGDARAFVSSRFIGSASGDAWPCTGTVVLDLPLSAVLPFAGDGTAEDAGPGRCRYTAGSWSWIALAASLNRFDTAVEVVGPPELREAFAELAARNAVTAGG